MTTGWAVATTEFETGSRFMVVEPSGFATDWAAPSMTVHATPDAYDSTVGAMNREPQSAPGRERHYRRPEPRR